MATSPWIFVSGRKQDGELSERSEFSPSPPGYKNPRRHQGQERQRPHRRCAGLGGTGLLLLLLALLRVVLVVPAARVIDGLAFDFPALCGALNFCCKEEKGRETV